MTCDFRHIFIATAIVATVVSLGGCAGRNGASEESHSVNPTDDSLDIVVADTIVQPERPKVTNEAEAAAMMSAPDDSARYNAGILPRMLDEVPQYAIRLLNNTHDGFIIVDKYTMRVILYDSFGCVRKEYKMACSKHYGTKHKKADNRTPEGFFSIEGIYDSTDWLYTDDDGKVSDVKGQFGPKFLRLKIPVTSQIGIHGTCAPWSLGGRRSHGCIRISNENILELAELVEPGMPVIVSPGRRDMAVNEEEGYDIPAVSTGKTRPTSLQLPKKEEPTDTISVVSADSVAAMSPEIEIPVESVADSITILTDTLPSL